MGTGRVRVREIKDKESTWGSGRVQPWSVHDKGDGSYDKGKEEWRNWERRRSDPVEEDCTRQYRSPWKVVS